MGRSSLNELGKVTFAVIVSSDETERAHASSGGYRSSYFTNEVLLLSFVRAGTT